MSSGRVLVYGGRGALGSACVSHFKSNNWVNLINFLKILIYIFFTLIFLIKFQIKLKVGW